MTITINGTPEGRLSFDLRDDGGVWCAPLGGSRHRSHAAALYAP